MYNSRLNEFFYIIKVLFMYYICYKDIGIYYKVSRIFKLNSSYIICCVVFIVYYVCVVKERKLLVKVLRIYE